MYDATKIDRRPLALGLMLMVVGALLALARFDLLEIYELMDWWPLPLVAVGALVGIGGLVAEPGERPKALRTGAWLVVVACWLLVNTLELGGFRWWSSWPLIVMAAGAFQLAWPTQDEDRGGGFMTLAVGTWLLVTTRGYFGLGWGDSWPVLLVLAGVAMVAKAATQARTAMRRQQS